MANYRKSTTFRHKFIKVNKQDRNKTQQINKNKTVNKQKKNSMVGKSI
jgi:hypothetical protein